MEKDLISIIVPVYNAEKFLDQTISTVLDQTYKNWELILVNDKSTDSSVEIINKYIEMNKNIKLIQNVKNSGAAVSRNNGIEVASGKYIAFLDADDLWEKDKLEQQINVLKKNSEVGMVFTGSSFIDEQNINYNFILKIPEKIKYKELLKQNVISCSSVLIKKEYAQRYKMPKGYIHEDFYTWLNLLKDNVEVVGINKPLLKYRISHKSKSGNKFKAAKMNYNVYKLMKLNIFKRIYYMIIYSYRGIKKYSKIKKHDKENKNGQIFVDFRKSS